MAEMTRVDELMAAMGIDRRTAEFYAALESGESSGDMVIVDDDGNEVNPPASSDV